MKKKVTKLRKQHLVNAVNWTKQAPEDVRMYLDAVSAADNRFHITDG